MQRAVARRGPSSNERAAEPLGPSAMERRARSREPPPPPHEHEQWVVEALTPVLEAVYPKNPPDQKLDYALFLPAATLTADATVCRLVGMSKEDKPHATWKEVLVYRDRGVVHVYNLLSHGRRMYRSLVYSSAARFALAAVISAMTPATIIWRPPPALEVEM